MNKEKTYKGNLNVGKKIVYIDTDIDIRTIVINYVGELKIKQLDVDNMRILYGNNKLLIINLNKIKLNQLFEYRGMALFSKCIVTDTRRAKYTIHINKSNLELWNTLNKTQKAGTNVELVQTWESLTRYWEDIDFDGNNAKKPYLHTFTSYDKETKTYTRNKEIRKR